MDPFNATVSHEFPAEPHLLSDSDDLRASFYNRSNFRIHVFITKNDIVPTGDANFGHLVEGGKNCTMTLEMGDRVWLITDVEVEPFEVRVQ